MADDVDVIREYRRKHDDGSIEAVKIMRVPESTKFPDGIKYRLHHTGREDQPQLRYDNAHGVHERHYGETTTEIDYPGIADLYQRFTGEVTKRIKDQPPST